MPHYVYLMRYYQRLDTICQPSIEDVEDSDADEIEDIEVPSDVTYLGMS